jgi:hypothetical protein
MLCKMVVLSLERVALIFFNLSFLELQVWLVSMVEYSCKIRLIEYDNKNVNL